MDRGDELFEKGDFGGAMRHLNFTIRKDRDDIIRYGEKFVRFYEHGRYEEALGCANAGMERIRKVMDSKGVPKNELSALSNIMRIFLKCSAVHLEFLGRTDEALERHLKAARINPDDQSLCKRLGHVLEGMERFEEASRWYERAARLRPDDFEAHMGEARAFEGMRLYGKAASCYERATEAIPKDKRILKEDEKYIRYADARIGRAESLIRDGRFTESLHVLDDLLEKNPGMSSAHMLKAMTMWMLDKSEEAIACMDEGLKGAPKDKAQKIRAQFLAKMAQMDTADDSSNLTR